MKNKILKIYIRNIFVGISLVITSTIATISGDNGNTITPNSITSISTTPPSNAGNVVPSIQ